MRLRRTPLAAFVCAGTLLTLMSSAQEVLRQTGAVGSDAREQAVWFHHIQTPLGLSLQEGQEACKALYGRLTSPEQERRAVSFQGTPGADAPRAFFVSWSDGQTPASISYGMGQTADEAFAAVERAAATAVGASGAVRWVKLDVVQRGEAVDNFVARESRLPLPSLFGLTFGPASGFAFLPEQLIAWDMVDSRQRLTIHHIGQRLFEKDDLESAGRWLAISSFQGGQRICLFEPQSFFCDGSDAVPLFRGHRLYDDPDVTALLDVAKQAGDLLSAYCQPDGQFVCDLREWEIGKTAGTSPADQALAVIALCRLYQATEEAAYKDAAARAGARLCGFVRPYGVAPRAGCIPEYQADDEPAAMVEPRQITRLATNALAVVALCEVAAMNASEEYHPVLGMLARHLIGQIQPDGDMISERDIPSLQLRPRIDPESTSVAVLAFTHLYDLTARPVFLAHAEMVGARLRSTVLDRNAMESLPCSVWLMESLDQLFPFTRDRGLDTTVQRLGLAALLQQNRQVDFPDLYGSVAGYASATLAAERTHVLAVTARLMRDLGKEDGATSLLSETRPYVLFQLQGHMDAAASMYMENPAKYVGLFRDHLRDVGFELGGQARQILSLVALTKELKRLGLTTMPDDLAVSKSLVEARDLLGAFPRYLSAQLAATAAGPAGLHPVQFHDGGSSTITILPGQRTEGGDGSPTLRTVPVQRADD